MARRYIHYCTVSLDTSGADDADGAEFDVKVEFSVAWGSPETGRFGPPENYDPGSADEVEDVKLLEVEGLTSGWGDAFAFGFESDESFADVILTALEAHHPDMLADAADSEAGEAERAAECRAEMRREVW